MSATELEDEMTEEGKRKAWRLLALLDALRCRHPEPVSLDEIDLHDACAALRNGCGLDHLVQIFT